MWLLLLLTLAADGGAPDAGAWQWTSHDGGFLTGDGVTDVLTLRVGETATVTLERPIVLMQCDEQLLSLGATTESLLLTGVKAGRTRCGFWYQKRAYPHRYFDVTVTR